MDPIYLEICKKVSPKYHARIREILLVLDIKDECEVKVDTNRAVFDHNLTKAREGKMGYINLDSNVVSLNGTVNVYPTISVNGDLVVALVKNLMYNPEQNKTQFSNTLLIYEKKMDHISKIKQVVS